jgi:hypothetical protein
MARGVSRSTAFCLMRLPTALGGRNLPTPLSAVCVTLWSHLKSCCFDLGGLRELFYLEYKEALHTWDCHNLEELQRAVALNNLQWRQTTRNRFTYACFLADILKIALMWQLFPKDSIWCTPSVQLAYLLKDHRANLFIPGHSSFHRFQCTSIHEEADTVTLQDVIGVSVRNLSSP